MEQLRQMPGILRSSTCPRFRFFQGGRAFSDGAAPSDTNLNLLLTRIATNTRSPSSDPATYSRVVQKFALNSLSDFKKNGNKPVYPQRYIYTPSVKHCRKRNFLQSFYPARSSFSSAGDSVPCNWGPHRFKRFRQATGKGRQIRARWSPTPHGGSLLLGPVINWGLEPQITLQIPKIGFA